MKPRDGITLALLVALGGFALELRTKNTPPPELEPTQEVDSASPSAGPAEAEVSQPEWFTDYEQAGEAAYKSGKPLAIYLTDTEPKASPFDKAVCCWLDSSLYPGLFAGAKRPCVLWCKSIPASGDPEFVVFPYPEEK